MLFNALLFVLTQVPGQKVYPSPSLATQQSTLKEINREIVDLYKIRDRLEKSAELRQEEVASLRSRFSIQSLDENASVDQIIAALQIDKSARLQRLAKDASASAMANCLQANALGDKALADYAALQQADDYKKLTLAQRMELRRLIEKQFEENPQEDCSVIDQPVIMHGELMKE
jgi:hypothetical protein